MAIKKFVFLASKVNLAYNDAAKPQFHSGGKTVLRHIAKALNLPKGSYDIRSNLGGIAVSGEVTLHAENLYVQFSQSCLGLDWGFLARSCKGRRDYTGGTNNWIKWEELLDLPTLIKKLEKIAGKIVVIE